MCGRPRRARLSSSPTLSAPVPRRLPCPVRSGSSGSLVHHLTGPEPFPWPSPATCPSSRYPDASGTSVHLVVPRRRRLTCAPGHPAVPSPSPCVLPPHQRLPRLLPCLSTPPAGAWYCLSDRSCRSTLTTRRCRPSLRGHRSCGSPPLTLPVPRPAPAGPHPRVPAPNSTWAGPSLVPSWLLASRSSCGCSWSRLFDFSWPGSHRWASSPGPPDPVRSSRRVVLLASSRPGAGRSAARPGPRSATLLARHHPVLDGLDPPLPTLLHRTSPQTASNAPFGLPPPTLIAL